MSNAVFAAATFVAKSCGEIVVLVLRIFEPPKNLPPTLRKFHCAFGRNFWSVTSQYVRGSGKAESQKIHRQAQTGKWERQGDL